MSNPGPVARGRALTRLSQEQRERYRRIYASAPHDVPTRARQSWAQKRLTLEYPERYRTLYDEERVKLLEAGDTQAIDPSVVGKSTGPGPYHAVHVGHTLTACGRIQFHTYPATGDREVTCTYCIDRLDNRRPRQLEADPQFASRAAAARSLIADIVDLQDRAAEVRGELFAALSKLSTPPKGTTERKAFADLLAEAVDCGLTLQDIGTQLGLSRERIRQIAAERLEGTS